MKKKLLTACLMVVCLTASAQYVTTGQVVDKAGNPISGARVEAKGSKVSSTTGIDGRFKLETPKAVEKVKVSSAGRLTKTQEVSGNMSITLENSTWWTRPATRYQFFVSPQVTLPSTDGKDIPFGLMVGVVKNIGIYARYVQSAMPSTSAELDNNDVYDPFWTDKKTGYQAITGGLILRLGSPLYLTVGGGISNRKVAMQHQTGTWYDVKGYHSYSDLSYKGACAEVGLMMKIGHVMINGGSTMWNTKKPYFGANFGVGYMF